MEGGAMSIEKYGRNEDVDSAAPEDVWDGGGTYTFTTTAQTYYISSSNAGDTQDVELEILTEDSDGNWNEERFIQTIAGQTKTALSPPSGDSCVRINRFGNAGITDFAGDVYVYENDSVVAGVPQTASKIRAKVANGNNQTLMAIYTVPSSVRGAKLKDYYGSVLKKTSSSVNVDIKTRKFGGVFRIRHNIGASTTGGPHNHHAFEEGLPVDAKTDIKATASVSTDNTDVSAGFYIKAKDK
jgi:hypothetical protein